uniref:Transmembrane protein n=1 Tax=Toxoplasma gondii (strain ATCC 50861 / VEG) TaxID=432359 RepID=A0A0F7V2X0_TOXGV|nr:TPA: hypothetical protein BN1205_062580 [Toxoplasma gondii VEG]
MEKMSVSLKALCLAPFNASDFKAAVFGGLFGGLASFLVTHLLLELTFSPFFSVFFAILLASIAGLVIQRALAIDPPVPPPALGFADEDDSLDLDPDTSLHSRMYSTQMQTRNLLFAFAFMIILSALFALFVDKAWFSSINWVVKIPMYCLLGNTLCFLLVFAGVDIVNFYCDMVWWEGRGNSCGVGGITGCFSDTAGLPGQPSAPLPVHNSAQVCVLLVGSLLLGSVFGFFYGLFDHDDVYASVRLIQDRYVCVPIAVIIGTFTAVLAARLGRGPAPDAAPLSDNAWTGRTGSSGPGGRGNAADAKQMSTEEFLNDDEEEGAMLFGHNALVA